MSRRRFSLALPPLLWAGTIFALSSIPSLQSELPALWDFILRKLVHAFEFGVLAALTARAIGRRTRRAAVSAFVLATLYAVGDEWHQTFVVGRTGAWTDVIIDAAGATIGLFVYLRAAEAAERTPLEATILDERPRRSTTNDGAAGPQRRG